MSTVITPCNEPVSVCVNLFQYCTTELQIQIQYKYSIKKHQPNMGRESINSLSCWRKWPSARTRGKNWYRAQKRI